MDGGLDTAGFTGDQSQQGQGLAYVLPQSRTVGYFMQLANEQAQQRRDDAAAIQQAQQKANEVYANHLYANKTPEIAQNYSRWLQPKFDDLLGKMADYHTQTGQDPYTNPFFVKQFNDLATVAKNTHEANLQHTAYATQIADKSKNFTPESKQAGIDWLNAYEKDPVGQLYTQPPSLVERNLDMNDAVKLGHANAQVTSENGYTITAPNRHNHIVQGQQILSQPEFSPYLQSNGINTQVGDIGGQPNGTGGTIYPTDTPTVNAIADHILQNSAQPHYAQTLQAAGIDPLDPHAKDKLTGLIQRQNAGYGKVYSDFANRLDANVESKKVPDYNPERLAISEANLANSNTRLLMSQQNQANKEANKPQPYDPQPDYQIQYNSAADNGGFPIHAKNFVPLTTANKEFAGSPDVDVTNGVKPTPNSASITGKVVGVGDFPVFKNNYKTDNVNIVKGMPAGKSAVDAGNAEYKRMVLIENTDGKYLLDYNKLPANVKNSKQIKEALGTFDKTPVGGDAPIEQTQSTKLSPNDFSANWAKLPKGGTLVGPDGITYTKK